MSTSNFEIEWTKSAEKKFDEIITWHKKKSVTGPKIVHQSLQKQLLLISKNPFLFEIDHLKNEPNRNIRVFIVHNIRVSYFIDKEKVIVLRLRHTSQEPLEY